MSEKTINYMARDFNTIKSELIELSKQYYPELSDSFNDASVGSWLIDLVSAVGDDLNYYIDRCYNEQNVNTASLKSSVLNTARANNFKVPGPKAAMCEVAISVDLKPNDEGSGTMSLPNWNMAPKIKQGAMITNGSVEYEILEDVDFSKQFNNDAVSNRFFFPLRDARGAIVGYRVTKTVLASSGRSRIYKKLLRKADIKPFMEVLLPFKNIMGVEGVIFKDTTNLAIQPELFEFYLNDEEYYVGSQTVKSYRYFEVNSLADQYRFGDAKAGLESIESADIDTAVKSTDENGKVFTQFIKGSWIPVTQKYITEYTDSGYLKLIFGSGTELTNFSEGDASDYAKYQLEKIANNELTGRLPQADWVMYVLYRDGGGQSVNLSPGSLTKLGVAEWEWPSELDPSEISKIKNSVLVTNTSQGIGGVNSPSVNEIKYLTRYNNSAQERCVTLKDYELRVKMMPAKYGAPYRCKAIEDNNKIFIYMLGIDADGHLDSNLPEIMTTNVVEYLKNYKSLGDLVELRSAQIFNLSVEVYACIDKTYNKQSVIKSIIETVRDFFNIENHNLGDSLYIGDLEKEISSIDGVVNLEKIFLNSRKSKDNGTNDKRSSIFAPLPYISENNDSNYEKRIDLESMNKVLSCDAKGMFEIYDFTEDITVKVRTT